MAGSMENEIGRCVCYSAKKYGNGAMRQVLSALEEFLRFLDTLSTGIASSKTKDLQ